MKLTKKLTNNKIYILLFAFLVIIFFIVVFQLTTKESKNHFISKPDNIIKDSIITYHNFINQAELDICDNYYNAALINYDSAFLYLKNSPFIKDLYNASLVAIYLKKNSKAISYCELLIEKGCKLEFFNQIPFQLLKKDTSNWVKLERKYKELREKYKSNVNINLLNTIRLLNNQDQNNYCGKTLDINIRTMNEDSIYIKLKNILYEYGYPNNSLIGVSIKNDTSIENNPLDVIIRHYYQNGFYDLSDFLLNQVYKGNILPEIFVSWDEFRFEPYEHYGSCIFHETQNGYYILNDTIEYNKKIIAKYNFNRKKVLMFSYKDQLKKLIFSAKFPNKKFRFYRFGHCRHFGVVNDYLKRKNFTKINLNDY